MSSLISDAEKAIYSSMRMDIFDTFARDITIYDYPQETVVASTAEFNHLYQNVEPYVNYTPTSGTYSANILYNNKQEMPSNNRGPGSQQIDVEVMLGDVRIKVKEDAYQILMHKQEIVFDGTKFELISAPRPHGLFNTQLYTFFLRRKV